MANESIPQDIQNAMDAFDDKKTKLIEKINEFNKASKDLVSKKLQVTQPMVDAASATHKTCRELFEELKKTKDAIREFVVVDNEGKYNISAIESDLKKAESNYFEALEQIKEARDKENEPKTKEEKKEAKQEQQFEESLTLDGGDPRYLYVTSATKVGDIDRALNIWKKIQPANGEERSFVNQNVQKLEAGRRKIINYANSKVGKMSEENKVKLARMITSDKNYKYVSIDAVNRLLPNGEQGYVDENELNGKQGLMWDILEGKTGVDYMTVVKSTLAISGIALLSEIGAFSAIATGFGMLATFNPVIAACAAVLGAATVIKYARQLFAPEIKKLIARHKTEKQFATLMDMEGFKDELGSPDKLDEFMNTYGNGVPPKKEDKGDGTGKGDGGKYRSDDTGKGDGDGTGKGDDNGKGTGDGTGKGDDNGKGTGDGTGKGDDNGKGDGDGTGKGDDDGKGQPIIIDNEAPTWETQFKEVVSEIDANMKTLDGIIQDLVQISVDVEKATTPEQTEAIHTKRQELFKSCKALKGTIESLQSKGKALINQNVAKKTFKNPQKQYLLQLKIDESNDKYTKFDSQYKFLTGRLDSKEFDAKRVQFGDIKVNLQNKIDQINEATKTMKTPEDVKEINALIVDAKKLYGDLETIESTLKSKKQSTRDLGLRGIKTNLDKAISNFERSKGKVAPGDQTVENDNTTPTVDTTDLAPEAVVIVNQIKNLANKILNAPTETADEKAALNVMVGDFRAVVDAFKTNYPAKNKVIREIDKLSEKVEAKALGKNKDKEDDQKLGIFARLGKFINETADKVKNLFAKENVSTEVAMTIEEVLSNIENSAEVIKNSNSNEEILQQAEKYHAWKGALKHYQPSFFTKLGVFFDGLGVESKIRKAAKEAGKEEPKEQTDAKKSESLITMVQAWNEIKSVGMQIYKNPNDPAVEATIKTFNDMVDKFKATYKNEPEFDVYMRKIESLTSHIESAKGNKIRTEQPIENEISDKKLPGDGETPAITDGTDPNAKGEDKNKVSIWSRIANALKWPIDKIKGLLSKEPTAVALTLQEVLETIESSANIIKTSNSNEEILQQAEKYRAYKAALKHYHPAFSKRVEVFFEGFSIEAKIRKAAKEAGKEEPKEPTDASKSEEIITMVKAWNEIKAAGMQIFKNPNDPAVESSIKTFNDMVDKFKATYKNEPGFDDYMRKIESLTSHIESAKGSKIRTEQPIENENSDKKLSGDGEIPAITDGTDPNAKGEKKGPFAALATMLKTGVETVKGWFKKEIQENTDEKALADKVGNLIDRIKEQSDKIKQAVKEGKTQEDIKDMIEDYEQMREALSEYHPNILNQIDVALGTLGTNRAIKNSTREPAKVDSEQKGTETETPTQANEPSELDNFISYVKQSVQIYLGSASEARAQGTSRSKIQKEFGDKVQEILKSHPESADIVGKLQAYFAEIEAYVQTINKANTQSGVSKSGNVIETGKIQAAKNAGLDKATLEALGIDPNSLEGNDGPGNNG